MIWNLFYRNGRLLILVISLIVVAGSTSYYVLPRMEDPVLTPRFALVNTRWPGADALRVEALVTEPLEEALRELNELKELRSTSRAGISTVNIELRDDITDTDSAWSRVRDKLSDAIPELPADAFTPVFEEVETRAFAFILGITWDHPSPINKAILHRLAIDIRDDLKAVTGTEDVTLFGAPKEEYLVTVRPEAIASMDLTFSNVASQLAASDARVSSGQLRSETNNLIIELDTQLDSLQRIRDTTIRNNAHGQTVRVADVASVSKGQVQPAESLVFVAGRPGIALGILARDDVRIDHWSNSIDTKLNEIRARLPNGISLETVFQQNDYVGSRLTQLLANLWLGSCAVVAVVWIMMGWRNAIVVGLSLPLSAMMVIVGLRFLEIPIHQMSVTGLIIALGLLIDNAIVMVDEVSHQLHAGQTPGSAVARSTRRMAVPLFGSTVTTALAFSPIALMPGPAGEFVSSIAVSVILAITSSFLLAMTIVPALAALVRPKAPSTSRWWQSGWTPPRLTSWYRRSLNWTFARPWMGVALGAVLPVMGFIQSRHLPEQFFPPADRDQFHLELELPARASLSDTEQLALGIRHHLLQDARVKEVHWFLGESAPSFYYNLVPRRRNMSNYGQAMVQLDSAKNVRHLIRKLQVQLDHTFPGARILVRQLEQGPPFDAPIEVRFSGTDLDLLAELGEEVRGVLATTHDVIHTRSELADTLPNVSLILDETETRVANLTHAEIARQLNLALEGATGGMVLEDTEGLPVRVRLADEMRGDLTQIESLDLTREGTPGSSSVTSYGAVPLSSLGHSKLVAEMAVVQHLNGERIVEIQGFVPAGVLPDSVLQNFASRWNKHVTESSSSIFSSAKLPAGYELTFGGEAAKRDEAVGNLMANLGVLVVLMITTLVLSFGSFRAAGIVFSVAGLSVGLGMGALWLFGFPFGFMAIVGTMGLVGIAINDAIVVLAGIREIPDRAQSDPEAMIDVVYGASRHVIATSMTTIAGFVPLLFGGGGFWPPLAVSIAGGVGGATMLALYFVPAVHVLLRSRTETVIDETVARFDGDLGNLSHDGSFRAWPNDREHGEQMAFEG